MTDVCIMLSICTAVAQHGRGERNWGWDEGWTEVDNVDVVVFGGGLLCLIIRTHTTTGDMGW